MVTIQRRRVLKLQRPAQNPNVHSHSFTRFRHTRSRTEAPTAGTPVAPLAGARVRPVRARLRRGLSCGALRAGLPSSRGGGGDDPSSGSGG